MAFLLSSPVDVLSGVGTKRVEILKKSGIETLEDLLFRFPNSYRSGELFSLSEDRIGKFSYFSLAVESAPFVVNLKGRGKTLRYTASDEDGTRVHILYFNQPYLKNQIFLGQKEYYGGILQEKGGVYYLFSPAREKNAPNPEILSPVYSSVKGLSSKQRENLISQFLPEVLPQIKETLPQNIIEKFDLMPRRRALFILHRPSDEKQLEKAKHRFAFEELFRFSVQASIFASENRKETIPAFSKDDLTPFLLSLPFALTGAQRKVIEEIRSDICGNKPVYPMDRLVQGDVGSGKTIVAAAAAFLAAQNGKSTLVMAPTEILATQHYLSFSALFEKFGIPVFLLTGSTKKKEREEIFSHTKSPSPYILIGTHALIEDSTRCEGICLAITDEQHRFGVNHRNRLGQKGDAVHSLVMSATPIPRSLAMFLHAKSRISIIDELPPGRQSIDTLYVGEDKLPRVYSFLRERILAGNQAYVVCPLIEDEENTSPLQSAAEELHEIQKNLPEFTSALLHGKIKPEEKSKILAEFKEGKIKILVSTTVIEVGIDVPNATAMVIRSAERFGLSQLHQLRGRVGRGSEKSYCILISSHSGKSARERLKKLCDCHDGFELAKFDLKTRGPGEFFGTRQSGFGGESFTESFSMEMISEAAEAARIFLENATEKDLSPFMRKMRMN